jgi:large subunit ribosomal protein L31e
MAEEKERIYVIPLKAKNYTNSKAADTAVRRVKNFLTRHMKVEEKDIWIDESLNRMLWSHGKYSMPNRVRVKAVKFDDGIVEASLPELEFKKSRREILREEREKKTPVLRKEEMPEEEEEGEGGADDYEMVPTADGDVKLKKKKPKKEKESEEKSEESEKETKDSKKT